MSPATAILGLAGTGAAIARRLRQAGIAVALWDGEPRRAAELAAQTAAQAVADCAALPAALSPPRVLWLALPGRAAASAALDTLAPLLAAGDLVVDATEGGCGGSAQRALAERGIGLLDAGVAGGELGERLGFMVALGGDAALLPGLERQLDALGATGLRSWLHCGPPGSGRFVGAVQRLLERGASAGLSAGAGLFARGVGVQFDPAALFGLWQSGGALNRELGALAEAFLEETGWREGDAAGLAPAVNLALGLRLATRGVQACLDQLAALVPGGPAPR